MAVGKHNAYTYNENFFGDFKDKYVKIMHLYFNVLKHFAI